MPKNKVTNNKRKDENKLPNFAGKFIKNILFKYLKSTGNVEMTFTKIFFFDKRLMIMINV
jgi:hypothetical protein